MKTKILLVVLPILLTSCSGNTISDKKIVVGASSTPHALILEQTKNYVTSKGYELVIKVMNDYVTPNLSLRDGDLDANYFQHQPYLTDFNSNYKTDLVSAGGVHFEPMGIYKGSKTNKKVIIPNDKSNGDRAKELLKVNGYTDYTVVEMEAQSIPLMLDDCEIACINGNYALSSNVTNKVIVTESTESEVAKKNTNVVAVRKGTENDPCIKVLMDALYQDSTREYIIKTFGSSVLPMF